MHGSRAQRAAAHGRFVGCAGGARAPRAARAVRAALAAHAHGALRAGGTLRPQERAARVLRSVRMWRERTAHGRSAHTNRSWYVESIRRVLCCSVHGVTSGGILNLPYKEGMVRQSCAIPQTWRATSPLVSHGVLPIPCSGPVHQPLAPVSSPTCATFFRGHLSPPRSPSDSVARRPWEAPWFQFCVLARLQHVLLPRSRLSDQAMPSASGAGPGGTFFVRRRVVVPPTGASPHIGEVDKRCRLSNGSLSGPSAHPQLVRRSKRRRGVVLPRVASSAVQCG